jgi:hypothetical protein
VDRSSPTTPHADRPENADRQYCDDASHEPGPWRPTAGRGWWPIRAPHWPERRPDGRSSVLTGRRKRIWWWCWWIVLLVMVALLLM